jgi:hypothetical protein
MSNILIQIEKSELAEMIENSVRKAMNEKQETTFTNKTYSITQAAKQLNLHHDTLVKRIEAGYVQTSPDGKRISGTEIKRYSGVLKSKKNE